MRSPSEIQQRAEHCIARAQAVDNPTDRTRWLQLADQWTLLGDLEFQSAPGVQNQPLGLWRGMTPRQNQTLNE